MQLWKKSEVFLEWLYKVLFHWTEFTAIRETESVIFRTGNVIKVLDKFEYLNIQNSSTYQDKSIDTSYKAVGPTLQKK